MLRLEFQTYLLVLLAVSQFTLAGCKEDFFSKHWKSSPPEPHNGEWMNPQKCSHCHTEQFRAWSGSLHSQTMGSGILWQLPALSHGERENCYRCHATFPIQQKNWNDYLDASIPSSHSPLPKSTTHSQKPPMDSTSEAPGIVCATCHIRGDKVYGPTANREFSGEKIHPIEFRSEFSQSNFCKSCHETPRDAMWSGQKGQKVNGKYLMDVYEDWKKTRFANEGKTCQSCHMPGRLHSWKGIHDPEFVRQALDISAELILGDTTELNQGKQHNLDSGKTGVLVRIENIGVGHRFPAYLVPRIWIRGKHKGAVVWERSLGWKVDIFLKNEDEDSRIPAGSYAEFFWDVSGLVKRPREEQRRGHDATTETRADLAGLELEIGVAPRYQYEQNFKYMLDGDFGLTDFEKTHLDVAYQEAKSKEYTLYRKSFDNSFESTDSP